MTIRPAPAVTPNDPSAMTIPGLFPGGRWSPIDVNFTRGGNNPRLLIVHHMEGSLAGTDSWFRNPVSRVSAHFGVGKDGTLVQWVSVRDIAWHAAAANDHSIGVECEGFHTEPLTSQQVDVLALLFEWAHRDYPAVSAWLNSRPDTGSGLSWHGLGGIAWGNHPDCPGIPAVHQLGEILRVATA